MNYDALPTPTSKPEATDFLQTLLNKNLRVGTTDGRMFWGSFKCTDSDCNLVLQHTYEYRPPSLAQLQEAAAQDDEAQKGKVVMDMTSRYLGLVVVPGKYITKIEVEEFASQLKDTLSERKQHQPTQSKMNVEIS
ncbi:N-alpha-acetyltransferase 38-A, NatC auxiliary subunit [Triangularia setosa]|uniref:N-alpha-acetyltransferase 38-A, NatC auxiliary subunit n=1 Tax=Triangularia setosa TaxID=2587417 RepID=A0AAN6W488_9PEZI|nr:N-alpha-acetyltransferase 38-A, NatC auxiliary subunit [Podospora setosa]